MTELRTQEKLVVVLTPGSRRFYAKGYSASHSRKLFREQHYWHRANLEVHRQVAQEMRS